MTRELALYHLNAIEARLDQIRPLPIEPYRPNFELIPDPDWSAIERRRLTVSAFGMGLGVGMMLGVIVSMLVIPPPL